MWKFPGHNTEFRSKFRENFAEFSSSVEISTPQLQNKNNSIFVYHSPYFVFEIFHIVNIATN